MAYMPHVGTVAEEAGGGRGTVHRTFLTHVRSKNLVPAVSSLTE
jgi:hypothetical protein